MRTIDIHAHLMPQCLWRTVDAGEAWYGTRFEPGAGLGATVTNGRRSRVPNAKVRFTPEERLRDMDTQGVDVQVVSLHTPLFGYDLEPGLGRRLARDVNDEIAAMTRHWPRRFAGLATLPLQDVTAAIDELERAVNVLGLKGAELDTVVNGAGWDEPRFQPQHNLLFKETDRFGIANNLGVIVEDALIVATLIFGGVLDACPDLKICIAHGGGPACFGMGRLDHGWKVRAEAREHIRKPPSAYQRRLYYDCVTHSEAGLRLLLDHVGADRVVLGSDWPFVAWHPSPVAWVQGLPNLSQEDKDKILWLNLEKLLAL